MLGRVKFFHETYGFIKYIEGELPDGIEKEDVENDIFFFYKDIQLNEDEVSRVAFRGDLVEFQLAVDQKNRLRAFNVKKIEEIIDGKKVLRAYNFRLDKENFFELDKFYMEVIYRINSGLNYSYMFDDKIVFTNIYVDRETAKKIGNREEIEDFFVKYI